MRILTTIFLCLVLTLPVIAQDSDAPSIDLDTVIITAGKVSTPYLSLPASASYIDLSYKNKYVSRSDLSEVVSEVPGLFALDGQNYAQDLRISLRGFGARSAFGIRGVKIVVDGIPETTPDGQGQLDNISISDITSIQVLQGANGSQYGNAAGGIIEITTTGHEDGGSLSVRRGSYGLQEYQGRHTASGTKWSSHISATYQRSTGYRAHSMLVQTNLLARYVYSWDKSTLALAASYLNSPTAQDPGGINLDQALDRPRSARDRNIRFDSGESINHWKATARYDMELSPIFSGYVSTFYSGRAFDGRLPFANGGAIDLNRKYGGLMSQWRYKKVTTNAVHNLSFGLEYLLQSDARDRFFNDDGVRGTMTLSQIEKFNNLGFYLIDQWSNDKWTIRGSVRYDLHDISVTDMFLADGEDSGERDLDAFNYSLGLNYKIAERHALFSNWSTSFETPVLSELSANPSGGGGFNLELEPMRARTLEVGLKGRASDQLDYSLSIFNIVSQDELIPFELDDFPGRTFFRNAGQTKRLGLETSLMYTGIEDWVIRTTYSYSNFTFDDYLVDGQDLSDTVLPGIPRHALSSSLTYTGGRLYARLSSQYYSSITVKDDASVSVDPYHIINMRFGYEWSFGSSSIAPYLAINNVLSTDYFDNLRLNAFGSRHYEPAAKVNWQLGCTVDF